MESFAPIKEDRGAFKSTKQIAFWNFFSHLTVIFQVKIDIILYGPKPVMTLTFNLATR